MLMVLDFEIGKTGRLRAYLLIWYLALIAYPGYCLAVCLTRPDVFSLNTSYYPRL